MKPLKTLLTIIMTFVMTLHIVCGASAHPGRTDSNGGHWNHSTGEYHYHTGEYAGQPQSETPSQDSFKEDTFSAPTTDTPSDILFNLFIIAVILFVTFGALDFFVRLFTFIRDSVIISKNEKYNLIFRTECEGIFLYYANVRKEGKETIYKNIVVEVKVVSHYRSTFHKPTQEHRVFSNYTSYELQRLIWNNNGYDSFVDGSRLPDNKLIMGKEVKVTSSKGNIYYIELTPKGVDVSFQQIKQIKEKERKTIERHKQLKKYCDIIESRVKNYETIFPVLKEYRNVTPKQAREIYTNNKNKN